MTLAPGVHSVLPTPFAAGESLDEESIASLVDYYLGCRVDGVLVLGVLGEADKLSDGERERVQRATIAAVAGRAQVTVGVSHPATVVAAERARAADRAGATAVMVSPPRGAVAGPALREHFRRVADGLPVPVPVLVQDFPAGSGVTLSVEFLAGLADVLPPGSSVKEEDPPTPAKTAALVGAAPALTVYEAALPLLSFTGGSVVGLGLRKEILRRAGVIRSATVRAPAATVDERALAELTELLEAAR